jgi:hypothetical protein
VEYNYASIDDGSRLISMVYPNGRQEDYLYADALDSAISRVSAIAEADKGTFLFTGGVVWITPPPCQEPDESHQAV